jgi:hypothetical protein
MCRFTLAFSTEFMRSSAISSFVTRPIAFWLLHLVLCSVAPFHYSTRDLTSALLVNGRGYQTEGVPSFVTSCLLHHDRPASVDDWQELSV